MALIAIDDDFRSNLKRLICREVLHCVSTGTPVPDHIVDLYEAVAFATALRRVGLLPRS